ncbi:uncharacterized protein LOC142349827 [Convolutriloba macropyga]|uniref:uncharacterized protein LOC142349827 n=1 Tax=Convolutriloba macropyga TaxID=536237 RepID=UPI003F51DD6C
MPLYTFGDAAGSSSDERGNSREASNEDEEDGYEYDENGAIVDDEEDYDEDGSQIAHEPHKGARMSPMMVYVETLTGTAFEVRVSSFEAVISIKDKIQRLEGIPISQQHLLYDNMEMRDDYTLRDYNIRNGATLRLVLGMRGGPINTRRVPVEDPVLRDMDLLEAKEQLSRRLSSSSNNHFTILVLRNGQQVNLYRVVDRNDGSASASSVSSGGSRCDKVSASVGTTAAQRDNESGQGEDCDEDDEDEVEEDEEASDKSEDENHHGGRKAEVDVDEPTRMAVKLANLRMKMHQNKRGNKTTFGKINNARTHEDSLMLGPPSKPTSISNTSLPPILNGQPAARYKYQRSLLSNPVPTNPVTVKGQSKDYQQPQPRYLRMKSLHGILANERTEILETNEEDAQEGDISSEMGANQDIAGPSKSNFDKAQYLSGNNESSLGIMPRTSYAISQIIDPSAEQSNYNLLKDQQGSTTSSGQIIGGPHHSLAKSLYNRDTVTNLTANDDDFARMRKRSNCRYEEAGSGENSNEEVKSYAFKSMPFDETTEEREQKELQEQRGKHSTTKQHENTEAPWLNPPDKNFDAFKIAQDIILGQQSLSSGAKGNSEGLKSRKVSTKLEHVEGKSESEDVGKFKFAFKLADAQPKACSDTIQEEEESEKSVC